MILLKNEIITFTFRKDICVKKNIWHFSFLNDIQISIEKRRKLKFVPPERVWLEVRDHYNDTPNVFDVSWEKSRNRLL